MSLSALLTTASHGNPKNRSTPPELHAGDQVCFRDPSEETDPTIQDTMRRFLDDFSEVPLVVLTTQEARWSSLSPQLVTLQTLEGEPVVVGDGCFISTFFLAPVATEA